MHTNQKCFQCERPREKRAEHNEQIDGWWNITGWLSILPLISKKNQNLFYFSKYSFIPLLPRCFLYLSWSSQASQCCVTSLLREKYITVCSTFWTCLLQKKFLSWAVCWRRVVADTWRICILFMSTLFLSFCLRYLHALSLGLADFHFCCAISGRACFKKNSSLHIWPKNFSPTFF